MKLSPKLKAFLLESRETSGLVFDLDGMVENAKEVKQHLLNQTLLMAVKSFPHVLVLSRVLPHLDGVDVSNINEFNLVKDHLKEGAEVWFTRASLDDFRAALEFQSKFKMWFTLEDVSYLGTLNELKGSNSFNISLRLNSNSLLSAPYASGEISRFGLDLTAASKVLDLVDGIHFHHGSEANTVETFKDFSAKVRELLKLHPKLIKVNFGGGWNLSSLDLRREISQVTFPIVLEPGRFFSEGFGHAFGTIKSIKKNEHHLAVEGSLSVASSMRWSRNIQMMCLSLGDSPVAHEGRLTYGGPTCYEGDTISFSDVGKNWRVSVGDKIIFHPISGYSFAWNKDFNGIKTGVFFLTGGHYEK